MSGDALRALSRAIMTAAPRVTLLDLHAWMDALEPAMRSSGITTPNRVAAFIGQIAFESEYFTKLEEDLNYSAERLCKVWPGHFADLAAAEPCAGQPEKLANLVYGSRFGNGPPGSGDGWLYRGRGPIQITFRANYEKCAAALKMSPEHLAAIAATPAGGALTACWFWTEHALNARADAWDIQAITKTVQGSTDTALERLALSQKTRTAITAALAAA